jgi:hypothetical protein
MKITDTGSCGSGNSLRQVNGFTIRRKIMNNIFIEL